MDVDSEIIQAGILRKKGGRVNTWGERYFVLRGHTLFYYVKSTDTEPKGSFQLQSSCQVSKISSDVSKKRKQFVFKISWKIDDENEEKDEQKDSDGTKDSKSKNKRRQGSEKEEKGSMISGGKVAAVAVGGVVVGALTSGIGLLAGMMVVGMGAAAGGGAVALNQTPESQKERVLMLASDSYHETENWVNAIETQIQDLGDHVLGSVAPNGQSQYRSRKHNPRPEVRLDEVEEWITTSKWRLYDVYQGVRLLSLNVGGPVEIERNLYQTFFNSRGQDATTYTIPCMRVNVGVNGSAADTFSGIINFSKSLRTGIVKNIRIVENIDNFNDIIHIKLEPIYIYPTWTAPRDFCVMRYWRDNSDGSYVICLDSTYHQDCPVIEGYVRGDLHAAYSIAPLKMKEQGGGNYYSAGKDEDEESMECMLTFIAQLDPKGWIWRAGGYQDLFLKEFMMQVLDVRDALDSDRFVQVHFDPVCELKVNTNSASALMSADAPPQGSIGTIPPPVLDASMWRESDASTFRVRGETYNTNKLKTPSAPALFKLICIDFFEVPEPTQNIAGHVRNRVNLALQRGDDSWVFVVNIMVPGPPYLSFVIYFLADKAKINEDTPFGRIARPFFFGNDDEFRNNRFKLIPKVIDGNMIIKMAVKDTPTLLGNKLKQYYHKGENYFELDVDVGSSSVARNVVGLAIGYSKNIVVDMGFCLQGNDEDELPEILMGTCTCAHVDSTTVKKL